ncbi:MAG: peptide-methionine (S)-S-oxide reductase MsrA [Thalassotalea sp.]
MNEQKNNIEIATFAGGCFWCIESAFNSLIGVDAALSGYMGGSTENPTYQDICTGQSGHAEVVQISFDNKLISYQDLLAIFFTLHDPTQLNRQGNDVGTQYRSAVFYHCDEQKEIVKRLITELNNDNIWPAAIMTELTPASRFYVAEDYHQDYVSNNPQNPYCQMLVLPKLAKFRQKFRQQLK